MLVGLAVTCEPVVWFNPDEGVQLKLLAVTEEALSVVDWPTQIELVPEIVTTGRGLTVMVFVTDVEQLLTVTV